MTTLITFECDHVLDAASCCARRISVRTADVAEARRFAAAHGWFLGNSQQGDRCPGCSGRRP